MTIIQPNKNNKKANLMAFGLTMAMVIMVAIGVSFYNQLINLRHEIASQETNLQKVEVTNAELKNNLYRLTDNENLQALATDKNLVLEKNPKYVKINDSNQLTSNN